jgi:antitoxin HicB
MFTYKVDLTPDDNDTFLVTCPALPEVTTFGDTEAEALGNASDAIVEALAGRIAHSLDIPEPEPGGVLIPSRVAMKVLIYKEMQKNHVTKYRLTKLLGVHPPQVDRLLDVRYNTNFDAMDEAMSALDSSFVIAAQSLEDNHA